MKKFNKVAIIGVGEIGGSIGKDIKRKHLAGEVIGIGRRSSSLAKAKRVGAVDRTTLSVEDGVKDADLIIVATPVCKIPKLAIEAALFAKQGALITDVGSTKKHIVKTLEKALPGKIRYVGSHPMAGSEKGGPLSAQAGLFKGHLCFVARTGKTNRDALRAIKGFWKGLGSNPIIEISPEKHDRIVARISHMVHLAASALVISNEDTLKYAASGFRDTTRIALSDPELWVDICLTNNVEIVKSLDSMIRTLRKFRADISSGNTKEIKRILNRARSLRQGLR